MIVVAKISNKIFVKEVILTYKNKTNDKQMKFLKPCL